MSLISKAAVLANRFILNHEGILFYANPSLLTHTTLAYTQVTKLACKEKLVRAASVSICERVAECNPLIMQPSYQLCKLGMWECVAPHLKLSCISAPAAWPVPNVFPVCPIMLASEMKPKICLNH